MRIFDLSYPNTEFAEKISKYASYVFRFEPHY